jgi:hypothetical protein
LDTRTKIVPAADAARIAESGATVVSGYFDPLVAAHAERLRELKRDGSPLLVILADPESPILPLRARAELVAGLKAVDYVAELSAGIVPHVRLEQEHGRLLEDLVAHVHTRQSVISK